MNVHKYGLLAGIVATCPALRAHGVELPFDAVVGGRDASGYLLLVCAGTVQGSGGRLAFIRVRRWVPHRKLPTGQGSDFRPRLGTIPHANVGDKLDGHDTGQRRSGRL